MTISFSPTPAPAATIRPAITPQDVQRVKELFQEYTGWITQQLGVNLDYQGVAAELASLPGAYSPPGGCLLLAEVEGRPVGCGALRPSGPDACEMKRLYVRPEQRGTGLGKRLAEEIIRAAKERGYRAMRLDTLDSMKSAQKLYGALGFRRVPAYYELPAAVRQRTIFMELSLE